MATFKQRSWLRRWQPGGRLLLLFLSAAPLATLASLRTGWTIGWWSYVGLITALMLMDAWRVWRQPLPIVKRHMETHLPVAVWSPVQLALHNTAARSLRVAVYDWYPESFQSSTQSLSAQLAAKESTTLGYRVFPQQRGSYQMPLYELRLNSPWRLWWRCLRVPLKTDVKVYPNYAELGLYLLLAGQRRLDQLGIHRYFQRGQGGDFHQLREFRTGDTLRQVDWKAASRYQRLISREYRDDRDQQILFLLDTGRRMRHSDALRGHLDDALDAMLLLAFVALRQGDAVGMMSFGGEQRWFAPRKGEAVLNHLLNAVYDLQAQPVATDYLETAQEVLRRQRRRSLIVLLTNSRDEDRADLMEAARLLRRRHLVVIADLREAVLDEMVNRPPKRLADALGFYAAEDYLAARRSIHQRLDHHGVHMLDVLPAQLAAALVNEYQRLKRSGQLAV